MPHARLHTDAIPSDVGSVVRIGGEEAHHAARVRRLEPGDKVALHDGLGGIAETSLVRAQKSRDDWSLELRVDAVRREPAPSPPLEVWASAPKGDRLEAMLDGLSQIGASAWRPLLSERTVVEPRPGKLDRLRRVTIESMKQCGRAWALSIGEPASLARVFETGAWVVVAHADAAMLAAPQAVPTAVRLVVGPEGGLSPTELESLRCGGATLATFGPHIMRIETAAVVAASATLAVLRRAGGP